MKSQRRFAPTGGEFAPELVARFIGIRSEVDESFSLSQSFKTMTGKAERQRC